MSTSTWVAEAAASGDGPGDRLALTVLGSTHLVRCGHKGVQHSIARLWRPFMGGPLGPGRQDVPGPAVEYAMSKGRLVVDGETVLEGADAPLLLGHFAASINACALGSYRGLAVHAGVVARGGEAVAFPAASGAGKSTLTAAMCRTGHDYVSDEALCLRYEDGSVEGYPKPLALSAWSARVLDLPVPDDGPAIAERLYSAQDVAQRVAGSPMRLTHVVLPEVGHDRPVLTELDRGGAVQALLRMSFNHFHRPPDALRLVAGLIPSLRLWRLTYGDPAEAAELLADRLT